MWSLELHIKQSYNAASQQFETGANDVFDSWHIIESVETYSEKHQWEKMAEWKMKHNLDSSDNNHFFCLSRLSHGVNEFNEEK
jgi:hypothetical protein